MTQELQHDTQDTKTPSDKVLSDAVLEESVETSLRSQNKLIKYDLDTPLQCGLTRRELEQMKHAGLPKPQNVSWGDWMGPKQLKHRHLFICYLAAMGKKAADIAARTGMSQARISVILGNSQVQEQIKVIREIEFRGLGVVQGIDRLSGKALAVMDELLNDPATRPNTKFAVAKDIMDRKLGRATQRIEAGGSLLKDFMEMLKEKEAKQIEVKKPQIEVTDAEIVEPKQHIKDDIPAPHKEPEGQQGGTQAKPAALPDEVMNPEWFKKNGF